MFIQIITDILEFQSRSDLLSGGELFFVTLFISITLEILVKHMMKLTKWLKYIFNYYKFAHSRFHLSYSVLILTFACINFTSSNN